MDNHKTELPFAVAEPGSESMRVTSGAGEFEITISKVINEDRNVVMVGKMGVWEAKLTLTPREALNLAKGMTLPLLKAVLK